MKLSRYYLPTLKETPADAEVVSHQLMLRAGMIRLVTRGIFEYLPIGLRVVRKVEQIVREEMNRAGALEVLLPFVQPKELWDESGRWERYKNDRVMAQFKDQHQHEYGLAPTAEEVITDLVRKDMKSYRDVPKNFYQIGWKFRDEIRPRFGLMRGREFLMKDAYSFDADVKTAKAAYWRMYYAYRAIFSRCGLEFRPVEADTGAIGGNMSHEFQVLAETGEDAIAVCSGCEYAANVELAEIARDRKVEPDPASLKAMSKVATPGKKTIAEVSEFLKLEPKQTVKTLVYDWGKEGAAGTTVLVLLRGDHELRPEKLKKALGAGWVAPTSEADVLAKVGPIGFLGPVNPKTKIDVWADRAVENLTNVVLGANEDDQHLQGVNHTRDFAVTKWSDLRVVQAGDRCPRCCFDNKETGEKAKNGIFAIRRGIEVGHVFYLGTRYSVAMKATYKAESGKEIPFEMGCYGIGVTRVAAAAIEQNHDKDGIKWPTPIAPFQVCVISATPDKPEVVAAADQIHDALEAAGIETLYDDRVERAGFKFKDADLVGLPYRIVVGEKNLAEGKVEAKNRATGEMTMMPPREAIDWAIAQVRADLARAQAAAIAASTPPPGKS